MRPSNYTIMVRLPEKEKFLLFHGYSGAVDVVERCVAELLMEPARRINDDNGTVSAETYKLLEKRGYLTNKTPAEESCHQGVDGTGRAPGLHDCLSVFPASKPVGTVCNCQAESVSRVLPEYGRDDALHAV